MHPDLRKLISWAEELGWHLEEGQRGSGHYAIRRGSEIVFLPNSPSDWRSLENDRAEIKRKTPGYRPEHARSPSYRHESHRRPRFEMGEAIRERDERDVFREQVDEYRAELESLNPRRDQARAKELARRIIVLETRLQ